MSKFNTIKQKVAEAREKSIRAKAQVEANERETVRLFNEAENLTGIAFKNVEEIQRYNDELKSEITKKIEEAERILKEAGEM